MRKTLILVGALLALTACEDVQFKDSGDSEGSWGGCCDFGCSDGSTGSVVADSSWECDDIATTQCGANGLDVDHSSFDGSQECQR